MPLKLAWAITIHKCQGIDTLDVTNSSLLFPNSYLVFSSSIQPNPASLSQCLDSSIAVAGMTLDYVKVHLKDIFAEGQVYVALSRARSMKGLQVIGNASRSYVKYVSSTPTPAMKSSYPITVFVEFK